MELISFSHVNKIMVDFLPVEYVTLAINEKGIRSTK